MLLVQIDSIVSSDRLNDLEKVFLIRELLTIAGTKAGWMRSTDIRPIRWRSNICVELVRRMVQ